MANRSLVTAGKPKIDGAIYFAEVGTTLPEDSLAKLDDAFKELGYSSDEGVKNTQESDAEEVNAWGGDVVLTISKSKKDQFQFKLIEALNADVLKVVFGSDNVEGTLESGIKVKINNADLEDFSFVFEMICNGGVLKRIVVPQAKVTSVGEITYKDNEPVGYEVTLQCFPDKKGNTHYEYIAKKKG